MIGQKERSQQARNFKGDGYIHAKKEGERFPHDNTIDIMLLCLHLILSKLNLGLLRESNERHY